MMNMSVDDDDDEGYEQRTDLEGRSSGHNISAQITPHNYPLVECTFCPLLILHHVTALLPSEMLG